jgi:hypothetical protein
MFWKKLNKSLLFRKNKNKIFPKIFFSSFQTNGFITELFKNEPKFFIINALDMAKNFHFIFLVNRLLV